MQRISDTAYSRIFLVGALWNILIAVPALVALRLNITLLFGAEHIDAIFGHYLSLLAYVTMWAAVLIFGVGYYLVSRDVSKNHGIVWMAIVGKLYFFGFLSVFYFTGRVTILGFAGGLGDLAFTLIFGFFLWDKRAAE